jgi:hypothetical protein
MFDYFKRVRCECTDCRFVWHIPVRRIRRLERIFEIPKGHPVVWLCQECWQGVVIPDSYVNTHRELIKIDPENPDPNTEMLWF